MSSIFLSDHSRHSHSTMWRRSFVVWLVGWFVRSLFGWLVRSLIGSFVRSFARPFFHSFVHSSIHLFIHSFVRTFVRSFVYSFVRSFVRSPPPPPLPPSFAPALSHSFFPFFQSFGARRFRNAAWLISNMNVINFWLPSDTIKPMGKTIYISYELETKCIALISGKRANKWTSYSCTPKYSITDVTLPSYTTNSYLPDGNMNGWSYCTICTLIGPVVPHRFGRLRRQRFCIRRYAVLLHWARMHEAPIVTLTYR